MDADAGARALQYRLFYLGDQSLDIHGFITDYLGRGSRGILGRAFLDQAAHALIKEVSQLPKAEQSKIPVFRSIQQLSTRYRAQQQKHTGIDGALLCTAQIVHYLEYVV